MTDSAPTAPKPLFVNPYADSPDDGTRFNAQVDSEEYNYVKCIRPKQGTMVTTINTLYHKLVLELKRRGIKDLTNQQQFEDFVARCVIVLPEEINKQNNELNLTKLVESAVGAVPGILANLSGSTSGGDVREASTSHDGRGTQGTSLPNPSAPHEQSNIPSSSEGTVVKPKRIRKSKG